MKLAMITCAAALAMLYGCAGEVATTEDSIRMEVETPKLEVGDGDLDMNPATDSDIDIDTPAPGDR